jgi:hypothetical protein
MRKRVNIVVTCTSRKRAPAEARLSLRNVRAANVRERATLWIELLGSKGTATVAAGDLYCGEHWSVVRSIPRLAKQAGIEAKLWICSAGYGLIVPGSKIRAYSATFATGDPDSVSVESAAIERRLAGQEWWKSLACWQGPGPERIRTISGIVRRFPRTALLIVASPAYLEALEQDLGAAARLIDRPDLLLIVSAGSRNGGSMADHLLPCDARLQQRLGGTRASLNARIARHLVAKAGTNGLDFPSVRSYLESLLRDQPPVRERSRRPMTDVEVRAFICKELRTGTSSYSQSLRNLRDGGRGCEQSRFATLYRELVNGTP